MQAVAARERREQRTVIENRTTRDTSTKQIKRVWNISLILEEYILKQSK